jgi:hypothetical protein
LPALPRTDQRPVAGAHRLLSVWAELQAAVVTLTARHRISRRGITELAHDLFGVTLSTGSADAICQRVSGALAGPHLQLQDWVLDQGAVHVDETGWRTGGEGRALWTATTPEATFLQIAEHCNREQFDALIGPFPGIVISDRWNGFSHLDPHQRQVCWSHLQRDFRRHADGLAEQKTFGEQGLELTRRVFAAWRSYRHAHHDRDRLKGEIAPIQTALRQLLEAASPKSQRTRWHRRFANNLLKVWPRSGPSPPSTASSRPTTPPSARSAHQSSTAKSRSAPRARPGSDSPNARSRPPAPAASSAARCSPISAS